MNEVIIFVGTGEDAFHSSKQGGGLVGKVSSRYANSCVLNQSWHAIRVGYMYDSLEFANLLLREAAAKRQCRDCTFLLCEATCSQP